VGTFDTALSPCWVVVGLVGPGVNDRRACKRAEVVVSGAFIIPAKRPRWSSVAKWTHAPALGRGLGLPVSRRPLKELFVGEGALTGRGLSSLSAVFLRGSTSLPVTDASSVGPLKEGFDLVGRLKYFLRLLRWSLLGTAVDLGCAVAGTIAFSTAF
jgi:hypothetical protein